MGRYIRRVHVLVINRRMQTEEDGDEEIQDSLLDVNGHTAQHVS